MNLKEQTIPVVGFLLILIGQVTYQAIGNDVTIIEIIKSTIKKDKYEDFDIDNFNIIIVAVDDISLQKKIFNQAKFLPNCLVNSVDSVDYCDFIFPSYIKKDNLTVAISTGGSSPAVAKYLRKYLEKMIPDSIGDFLREMKEYRKKIAKSKERMNFLDKKAQQYIQDI